jgi:hypothetical protein
MSGTYKMVARWGEQGKDKRGESKIEAVDKKNSGALEFFVWVQANGSTCRGRSSNLNPSIQGWVRAWRIALSTHHTWIAALEMNQSLGVDMAR